MQPFLKADFFELIDEEDTIDEAIDCLFELCDRYFKADAFDYVDRFISSLNVKEFSTDFLLAVLTATLPAKSKLGSRKSFYLDVCYELKDRGEDYKELTKGLK